MPAELVEELAYPWDLLSPEPGEHHRGRPFGFGLVAFGASVAGLRVEAQHRGFLVVV